MREGWTLLLPCVAGVALGSGGMPFYTFGLFARALVPAFGWTTSGVQSALTVFFLTNMAVIPLIGWLADHIGAKRVALISLVLFSLSFMSLSLMNGRLSTFRTIWFFIAATGTGTIIVTWTRVIGAAFVEARGLALGIAFLGTGVAGIACPPLAQHLIAALGWRASYVVLGLLPLFIAFPLAVLFLRRDHSLEQAARLWPLDSEGATISQALRGYRFWIIGGAFLLIAVGYSGLVPNLIKILTIAGRSVGEATLMTSIIGGCVILGRLLCGVLLDRQWAPAVALLFLVLQAAACIVLAQAHVSLALAVVAAVLIGTAGGADGDLLPYIVGRYFGLRNYGTLLGLATSLFFLGASLSSVALASAFDMTGSYGPGLWICALVLLTAAAALLLLGRYPVWPRPTESAIAIDIT